MSKQKTVANAKQVAMALRQAQASDLQVDRDAGVIRNVSVITAGEACGHNAPCFEVDAIALSQIAGIINAAGETGVKVRMKHAELEGTDGLRETAGRLTNARVTANQVKADFAFGRYAQAADRELILGLAEDAPTFAGLSIVPSQFHFEEIDGKLVGRFEALQSVDWTDHPAANPAGMLSQTPGSGGTRKPGAAALQQNGGDGMLNESQMEFLQKQGLPADASPEAIEAFVAELDDEQSAQLEALAGEAEPAGEGEGEAAMAGDGEGQGEGAGDGAAASGEGTGQVAASKKTKTTTLSTTPAGFALSDGQKAYLNQLNDIAALSGLGGEWALKMAARGVTPTKALQIARQHKAEGEEPVSGIHSGGTGDGARSRVTVGDNRNVVSLRAALPDAIMLRANPGLKIPDQHERANELRGMSVKQMARTYYQALGYAKAAYLSDVEIVNLMAPAFVRRVASSMPMLAQSSDSFSNVLADVTSKRLRIAYQQVDKKWPLFCRRETNPDFKTAKRVQLSDFPALTERNEGGEIVYSTVTDSGENVTLAEYISGIRITRRALINDDLGAFDRIPQAQAAACARLEDDRAFNVLTANAAMGDSNNLFDDTNHGNHTDSGGGMTVTSLGVAEGKMGIQTGPKGAKLNLLPKFLLVPWAKKSVADQLIGSVADPADNKGHAANPFANKYTVIADARLDDNSTAAWYLAADYRDGQIDTIEVVFLTGEEEPVLLEEKEFDTEDMKFAVRHTVVGKAIDWRGLYKNDGE